MLETMLLCVALNVWNEARGEEYNGQLAVAEVVMRRVLDPRWPSNACEVVYQPWQFEWTAKYDGLSDTPVPSSSSPSWRKAIKAAKEVENDWPYTGSKVTSCADHFYNPSIVTPYWDVPESMQHDVTVGLHKFTCSAW